MVGLDLGTSKVAAVIAEGDEYGQLNVTGVGEAPCEGLRKGSVVNIEKTVQAVQQAILIAERMAGVRSEGVIVSLGGPQILSRTGQGVIAVSRPDHEIGQDDVDRVVEASRAISIPNDRQVIHVLPRGFKVDSQEGVKEAVGMNGRRLEVETQIVTGSGTAVQNVIKCVHQSGLDVDEVVTQGLASGEGVLTANEMDLGVCLIDIGAGTSDVALYEESSPMHVAVLPVGGNHVTNDIAIGLRTTLNEAEMLKLNYGHTLPEVIPHEERIDVRQVGGDRLQPTPRRFLAEIIGPRMREIFHLAWEEVRRSGYEGPLPAGVVVTGGGARLMGTTDAALAVFDTSVRVGLPTGVGGLADRVAAPSFAAAVGLCKWGQRAQPAAGRSQAETAAFAGAYQKTVRWLRDFF
ncbi:MAG: cell division protein FtsA [Candidatus Dormibacter sp.]|uniref:cell division protein FtsA n=1 Tax=Candidatus Dormibacter sp. TaxID=2973982 RepID=UPI002678813F